ncbi:MAG: multidrug effflux MFS transporter [Xanthobacteraceae bacterium]|nr:multidrug effflux MFS transporter [Xanthobacteraceae bacterium]
MTVNSVADPAHALTPPRASVNQVAVLAALAATGTLATNIFLPSLPRIARALDVSTATVTSAITVFLAAFAFGQLVVGPLSDRYGRFRPVLIGFIVFIAGSIWCAFATDLPNLLAGRVVQALGACATSVLSRAIARDLFSGEALARALALIMIAMAAAPGFSPLLGSALDYYFGWRSEFAFVAIFASLAALAYAGQFGETHRGVRTPLAPRAIGTTYLRLTRDRRFLIPAAAVSLILGGLYAMFAATPRILIEDMGLSPMGLGVFFAGTVLIVFAAGMIATRLSAAFGLERPIQAGLLLALAGSIAILLVAVSHGGFWPFVGGTAVFLLGMGIVNPLGAAQALSPFGANAGAASALLGFWQMLVAAIGVWMSATIIADATIALGVVLTLGATLALILYQFRPGAPA